MRSPAKNKALIVDIDESICTEFSVPIVSACRTLCRFGKNISVHYVTARTEASRKGTEKFIRENGLPGGKNLHLCPDWKSSRAHKVETMRRLAKEFDVIASIGEAGEYEAASREAEIPFLPVEMENPDASWQKIEHFLAERLGSSSKGNTR